MDNEAMNLLERARAWLGEVGGFWAGEAQKAVSVVFDGAFFPNTAGMAILDGAYPSLPCPASPCPIPLCNLPKGRELKMAFATILGMW